MKKFGERIGRRLLGGETIELIGDVGAGKTTFTKGLALGLGVEESVQSPSFTISRTYDGRDGLVLSHYDFYRLNDAGIMTNELKEVAGSHGMITIIEWAGAVAEILPDDRLMIEIVPRNETERELNIKAKGEISGKLLKGIDK